MTSSQSETCVKLCSTYCCTALQTRFFYWNFERTEDIQAWSLGKVSMLSAWAGNDVGTSTWLVSVQFQNSAKGIWEKQGHGEHSSPALQGGNPLVKGLFSFSCNAPRLIAGEAWYIQGYGTAAKWPYGGCCCHCPVPVPVHLWPEEKEPLPCRMQGWSHSSCLCREWQSRASASEPGWNPDTCPQTDEVKWNFSQ